MKYQNVLQEIGLSKNEARIYETLLAEGELTVGLIAEKSGIHRRNVYDSMSRLTGKGLVFEILEAKNTRYQATDPGKLSELLDEKRQKLDSVLPDLSSLYTHVPSPEALFLYRGVEGWKNFLTEVLRTKQELLLIAATDQIEDPRVEQFMKQYYAGIKRSKIPVRALYRHDTETSKGRVNGPLASLATYRILPKRYPISASMAIFGDRTVIFTDTVSRESIGNDTTITFIVNHSIADSMHLVFESLW